MELNVSKIAGTYTILYGLKDEKPAQVENQVKPTVELSGKNGRKIFGFRVGVQKIILFLCLLHF